MFIMFRFFAWGCWISIDVRPLKVALSACYGLTLSPTLQPNTIQSLSHQAVGSSLLTRRLCVSSALYQQRQGFGRRECINSLAAPVPSPKAHYGLHRQQLVEATSTARCEKPMFRLNYGSAGFEGSKSISCGRVEIEKAANRPHTSSVVYHKIWWALFCDFSLSENPARFNYWYYRSRSTSR
jgi:hypothetical protein